MGGICGRWEGYISGERIVENQDSSDLESRGAGSEGEMLGSDKMN